MRDSRHALPPRMGLQSRLVLITALVLSACLGAVGWVLDRAFEAAVLAGTEEQLRAVTFGLLGAAEERDGRLVFVAELGEPRLSRPDSGLYAYVDSGRAMVWRSPSLTTASGALGRRPVGAPRPAPGEFYFGTAEVDGVARFVMAYTVIWDALDGAEMTFWVLADQFTYRRQTAEFRRRVGLGLTSAAVSFIIIQFAALRWGLAPVRRMAGRIRDLEAGTRSDVGNDYPRELSGLARNLNRFIANERGNRDRYRRAMDDLAHSLKTPLAVLKNALHELRGQPAEVFREQLARMQTTITHQLSRAAAVRTVIVADRVAVMPTAKRISGAVERAYGDRRIAVELTESNLAVRVDERDLMEMLGNLIENGFKYTHSKVRISTRAVDSRVVISVEDDGPGIPPDKRRLVLRRGARGAATTPGHGIGFAAALELAVAYGGRLEIGDSDLGGAAVRLELPA